MYGILNVNEKNLRNLSNLQSKVSSTNEKNNLIVLSNNQHRFELLPIASQQAQEALAQSKLLIKPKNLASSDAKPTVAKAENSASGIFGIKWF